MFKKLHIFDLYGSVIVPVAFTFLTSALIFIGLYFIEIDIISSIINLLILALSYSVLIYYVFVCSVNAMNNIKRTQLIICLIYTAIQAFAVTSLILYKGSDSNIVNFVWFLSYNTAILYPLYHIFMALDNYNKIPKQLEVKDAL